MPTHRQRSLDGSASLGRTHNFACGFDIVARERVFFARPSGGETGWDLAAF